MSNRKFKTKFWIHDKVKICGGGSEIKGCEIYAVKISENEPKYDVAISGDETGIAYDLSENVIAKDE